MKTAVCYISCHHGNTKKLLDALAGAQEPPSLIDISTQAQADLSGFDAVGFASGIYFGKAHESLEAFMERSLPVGKPVFFLYTCGLKRKGYLSGLLAIATKKGAPVLGSYGCRGYDTFGPFRLVGGIAKGHPDAKELQGARDFFASLPLNG